MNLFTIGRRNYLFANTEIGTQSSAVVHTTIKPTNVNNFDSYRYLVQSLTKVLKLNATDDDSRSVILLLEFVLPLWKSYLNNTWLFLGRICRQGRVVLFFRQFFRFGNPVPGNYKCFRLC